LPWVVLLALPVACAGPVAGPDSPVAVDVDGADPAFVRLLEDLVARARSEPRDPLRRAELGMAYDVNGFLEAAVRSYEQAAALDPREPRFPYLLGIARAAGGDLEGGLEAIHRSIDLDSSYAPAYLWAGQWLLDLGRPDEAEQAYRAALALAPGLVAARTGLARSLLGQERAGEVPALLEPLAGPGMPPDPYVY